MTNDFDLDVPAPDPIPEPQTGIMLWEKNFAALREETAPLKGWIVLADQKLRSLQVVDKKAHETASEIWAAANQNLKGVESARKMVIADQQDFIGRVNRFCKTLTEPIEQIKASANAKIKDYQKVMQQKAQEEQEKARQEREKLQAILDKEAKEKGIEGVVVAERVVEQSKTIRTEAGVTTYSVSLRKWEEEDISKVPIEYLMVDKKKVDAAVKGGIMVPGIRIWEETETRLRRG
jgi:hypothetical protein